MIRKLLCFRCYDEVKPGQWLKRAVCFDCLAEKGKIHTDDPKDKPDKQIIEQLQAENENLKKQIKELEEKAARTQCNINMALHPELRSY